MTTAVLNVSTPTTSSSDGNTKGERPAHHLDDTKTLFKNPWESFRCVDNVESWIRSQLEPDPNTFPAEPNSRSSFFL